MKQFLSVTKASVCALILALVSLYNTASAQLIDNFDIQYQVTQKGSIRFLGNTSTTCNGGCGAQAENPPAGTGRNNSFTIAYVNADTDPNTFSASSDSLVLPNCSEVTYAALYWGGQVTSGNANYAKRDSVRLRVNNGTYQLLRADSLIDNTAGYNSYHCYKNITAIVKANQAARFWVGNVVADIGATNLDAGWTIVVVYKNDNEDMKNLTIFDGLASVSGSLVVDVPISGFLTPPSGPVNLEFGNFTHDGDRSSTGDSLLFNGTGVFRPVFDGLNPANDVFNSTIGRNGVLNPHRLPNYGNTLGLDADIISPNNSTFLYIGNNATSATLRLKTGGETYLTQVLTTSIDVYEADVRLGNTVTDLNGGAVQAGDTLEYRIVVKNIGSDTSLQTVSVDTIAFNADYVPNSIRIVSGPNAGVKTDASADDQAEYISASNTVRVRIGRGANGATGGAMGNSPTGSDSTVYVFRATVTTDCPELACSNLVSNQAYIRGVSKISGNTYVAASNPSIFDGFGCPVPGATIVTVNTASCPQPPNITTSGCTPFAFSTLGLPGTYSFFTTAGASVTTTTTSGTYWAIRNVTSTCRDTIFITLTVNPNPNFTSATGTNPTCAGNLTNGSALLAGPAAADSVAYSIGGTFTGGTFVRYNSLSPANTITGLSANTYTIRVKTVNGCFIDRTVTLTNPANCAPGAVNDVNTTLEDTPVGGTVAANDTDLLGGTTLTFSTVTTPANGSLVFNPDGTYTYTPNANYNGTDVFTYRVCDNGAPSLCDTASVTITVTPVNDPPIALNDNYTTNEDVGLNILSAAGVLSNDSTTDGPIMVATLLSGIPPFIGNLTFNASGSFTYVPAANFNGPLSFTYAVCDLGTPNRCDTATAFINVIAVNDKPVAGDDSNTTLEDTPVSGSVTGNDNDVDGPDADYSLLTGPANGTVSIDTNGNYTYTPNANFNGTDQFTYVVCDGGTPSLCDTATVTINVTAVNDPPIAANDNYTTNEDVALNILSAAGVLANDNTTDGPIMAATLLSGIPPFAGNLTFNASGSFTYVPAANFNGSLSFTYAVCDLGSPNLCDTATAFINVTAVNDKPVAGDDTNTTPEDTPLNGSVTGNDNDVDGPDADYSLLTGPANGTVSIDTNGNYTYTPNAGFNGTNQFTYVVCDGGTPNLCDTATVTITIAPVNDAPLAVNDNASINEDAVLTASVTANDSDADGPDADYSLLASTSNGTLTLDTNGNYVYTPNANFNGTDNFTYILCDDGTPNLCDTATVNITINAVNDAPVAVNDTTTTAEDTPLVGDVTANDSDIDGPASNYSLVTGPAHGTVSINISGGYTYTPNAGYNGPDNFVYALCDGGTPNLCDTATVFITILPVNDAPVAANDNATVNEDAVLNASVIANDNDSDGPDADYSLLTGTTNGTLSLDTNGNYIYTPSANFNGVDSFTYVLCDDGTPNLCDTARVTITVTPVNDPPVANTDFTATLEGTPIPIFVDPNDFDIDGPGATYTPLTLPANGSVTNLGNGQFSYSPFGNFNGTDSFTYTICDGGTPNLCDTGTVIITVIPDNDAPDAVNDVNTTNEDTPLMASVTANDTDVDGPAANYTLASGPANGTVTVASNGDYTYTPAADFNGTDVFTYSLCDGGTPELCDTATVTITVTPVNDPPVAITDFTATLEGTPTPIFVDPNDFDIDGPGATYTPLTLPANGSVTNLGNGQFSYSPFGNFNGTDSFTYTICDGGTPNLCDTGTVIITVIPDNDAPDAVDDANTTNEDTPLNASVIGNDTDVDGPAANYTLVSGATNGTVTVALNGDYTYTPDANFNGVDTFVYSLCDGGTPELCDTAIVVITINAVNDAPVANNDTNTTPEETSVNGTVAGNDSDVDGPATNYTLLTSTINGTVTVSSSGNYTYTPNADFNGIDSFTYVLCDGGTPDLCDTAVVVITVTPVNDAPVASDDANTTIEDTPVSGTVAPNDNDIDGPSENYALITQPLNGTVTVDASGNYTYTPNNNYVGTDSFTYSICDGGTPDLCDTAVVVITINPSNDAPTAADIITETVVDEPVSINVSTVSTDPENNPLTYTYDNSGLPAGTIVDVTGNGTIDVTPPAGFSGTLTIPYTACDNSIYPVNVLCDTATITINVIDTTGGANNPPVANDDYTTVPTGIPSVNITPLNNDVDVNGNPLTPGLLPGGPNNGTATLNPDGSVTYTPTSGFYGNDTIPYVVCDNGIPALCDTAMIVIYVAPQTDVTNVGPVAADDFGNTSEDTPVTINLNTNDNDPDGNLLSVPDVLNNPANGTVTINPDGTVTYLPNPGYTGTDSFTYRICDDGSPSLCDTATVYVTINPANDAPTAADIITETVVDEPVSINVSTVCTDPENNPLTYTYDNSGLPAGTIVDVTGNGTIDVTPPAGFSGTLTIPYTVCDNSIYPVNVLCDTATITINVIDTTGGANNPPVANNDYTTVPVGTPSVNITPLNNDVDVNGNPLTPGLLPGGPTNGTATLNPDGSVTYTPTSGFYGNDTIPYVVCDNGSPALCDTAMIVIYVAPQTDVTNVGPVAADDFGNTQEDTPITIGILGNDNDPDGGTLGTPSIVNNPAHGTVVVNGDGTITYTPNNNYVGNDTLTYAVCDNGTPVICDTATVVITIGAVNDAPYADNIEVLSPVNTSVSVNVGAATGDPENNPLTYTYDVSGTPGGTVVTETGNGTIIVTPPAGFSGTITIPYSVCDNSIYPVNVLCDTATITVTIVDTTGSANNPVIANNDNSVTLSGTPVTVNPLANDFDVDGDVLSVTPLTGGPNNGTLTVNADGTVTYTPNTGFEGFDTIPYQVCDNGNPQSCDTALIIVYVAPQLDETNVAPLATDDYSSTDEDTPVTIDVLNNDSDPNGNTLGNPTIIAGPANGTVTVNADGTVTYTPNLNYNGTDTFTYVICDNGNPALCDTADVFITIGAVNDPPVAVNNTISTNEDTPITIGVLGNDSDVDNPLGNPTIIGGPSNGTAVVDANGNITYTPDTGFNGTDTIVYVICDGGTPNLCDTALVIITVGPVNDAPVAVDDAATTNEDTPVTIDVLGNDTDSDGTVNNPTIIIDPTNGTAVVDSNGTITYTPNPDYYGNDTLTYVICDNGTPVLCDTAIVVTTVLPVVDTPVIVIVPVVLPEDSSNTVCFLLTLDPTANPADIVVSLCDSALFGAATVSYDTLTGEVCVTYNAELIPGSNIETDSICLTITDTANNISVTVQVPIEITPKVTDIWVKGFSPNGDGNNDTYYIPAADVYQNNKVRIFNRWGDEVWFTNEPYNNTSNAWGGTNTQGNVMPDGTYYFVFDYNDGTDKKPEIRFVVIDRGQ